MLKGVSSKFVTTWLTRKSKDLAVNLTWLEMKDAREQV